MRGRHLDGLGTANRDKGTRGTSCLTLPLPARNEFIGSFPKGKSMKSRGFCSLGSPNKLIFPAQGPPRSLFLQHKSPPKSYFFAASHSPLAKGTILQCRVPPETCFCKVGSPPRPIILQHVVPQEAHFCRMGSPKSPLSTVLGSPNKPIFAAQGPP